jgi:outer membrane biogenesis lipoprotein LolB
MMRFHVILAVAALALAGCNANQGVNPSSQPASQVFAGHYLDYNPYNPISYAQNNTGIGGGGGK